jgi:glycosyltransferase involved in cell wall biosynthesis
VQEQFNKKQFVLSFTGQMDQMYKAPDILIKAVAQCIRNGLDIHLKMMGGGKHLPEMKQLVNDLNISNNVSMLGSLQRNEVFNILDSSDLFVLPSYQEGLPRATIEAMARALPCIGSKVGGFNELLPEKYLVKPGDVNDLVKKITEILTSPKQLSEMSYENKKKAEEFRENILMERRNNLYNFIKNKVSKIK